MFQVKNVFALFVPSVAVTVVECEPAPKEDEMVPEISPVLEPMLRPVGKPEAE